MQRLREIPSGSCHDEEMVMPHVTFPDLRVVIMAEEAEEVEAVVGAGVILRAVEIPERIEAGVVREVDGVCRRWIGGEAGILEHATVEDEFEHGWVGAVPTVGAVVGFLAEAMVGEVRAEIFEEWVFGAVGEEIEVET